MVVEALRVLLPPELQFLISDCGIHTAKVFQELARSKEFIQSSLRNRTWAADEDLAALLVQFIAEYNECPHQGLPISGLSPNEFANRIWLV